MNDQDLPLDLELTERVEVDDVTLTYFEEDWNDQEQSEVGNEVELDFPLTMATRQSKSGRDQKNNNPYGEDFVVSRFLLVRQYNELTSEA